MILCRSRAELEAALAEMRGRSLGFVPTMGALHEGHKSLLQRSVRECENTVLSIFVNPTQFGPNEDFSRYPRTLEADLALAENAGVDIVYFPDVLDIYPEGFSTFIDVEGVSAPLCGAFRPGHFRGVATVVFQLFLHVQPSCAYFGQKDIQQCLVIQSMVRDLGLRLELCFVPTMREADGVAMSSRNRYLSASEREHASVIYRALRAGLEHSKKTKVVAEILAATRAELEKCPEFKVQYLELRSWPNLSEIQSVSDAGAVLALAGFLGKTRLIDNIILTYRN